MKKSILLTALVAILTLLLASCNKSSKGDDLPDTSSSETATYINYIKDKITFSDTAMNASDIEDASKAHYEVKLPTDIEAAKRLNIPADLVKDALENKTYEAAFETDLYEAQQFGISGVPFFIFDRKYAVSGAQPVEHFLGALNQAFTEWQNKQPQPLVNLSNPTGDSCDINGNC